MAVPSVDAELGGIGGCSGGEFLLLLTSPVHTCALSLHSSFSVLVGGAVMCTGLHSILFRPLLLIPGGQSLLH